VFRNSFGRNSSKVGRFRLNTLVEKNWSEKLNFFSRYRSFAVEDLKITEIPILSENRKFKRRS